jgi:hypothetical protein
LIQVAWYADSTHPSCQAESPRPQETAPGEDVSSSWPSKGLQPASSFNPPTLTPRQSSAVPESSPLPLIVRGTLPGKDATITKEHTPTPESAASVSSGPNGGPETLNSLYAKNVEEAPAQIKPPPAAQGSGLKPDKAKARLFRMSQYSKAGGWGPTITEGGDTHPKEPSVKPPLLLDHICEVSTASATSASDPTRMPAGDAPSYLLKSDVPGTTLTGKKMPVRDKARNQHAQMELRKSARPPSGATSNRVDGLVAQEPKPAPTSPVDIPAGKGESERVDANTTTTPTATAHLIADEEWGWWY